MATAREVLDRITQFDIHSIVKPLLGGKRDIMLDLNRDQMMHGKRSDDSDISPEYTYYTRQSKIKKNRDPDVVTLYDTGGFHREMFLDVGSDEFEIDSMDYKSEDLKRKYGENIFGLSKKSKEEYISEVFPDFRDEVESVLKLEMK